MNRKTQITLGASIVALGGGYLIVNSIRRKSLFNKIAEAIGGAATNLGNYDAWFSPSYYQDFTNGNYILLTDGTTLQKARKIGDAFGVIWNDTDDIMGVMRSIPDGVALSQVSAKFQEKGYGDLRTKIGEMGKAESNQVGQILSQIPAYRQV
tara:strand:- start:9254 stop:9709 length:456 start_codon:yes stop_codon:yes gene_type:complete